MSILFVNGSYHTIHISIGKGDYLDRINRKYRLEGGKCLGDKTINHI